MTHYCFVIFGAICEASYHTCLVAILDGKNCGNLHLFVALWTQSQVLDPDQESEKKNLETLYIKFSIMTVI